MKRFIPGRPQWWQWVTILSLDAPAVAVLWQSLLARVAGVPLLWYHASILGLSIWLAYAADRWIEGWRLVPDQIRTQRHHFYQRWRWPLSGVWLTALATDLTLAGRYLTAREFDAGLLLLAPVGAYLISHQLIHRHRSWRAPKEICIALLFGGGVTVFLAANPAAHLLSLAGPLAVFCGLCFVNCALISFWERAVDEAHGQTSLALQFRHVHALTRALPWLVAASALALAFGSGGISRLAYACGAASGLLLGLLDRAESSTGPQFARTLADFALMTPAVVFVADRIQ